jgi:tetratricopeptide (TPR) repeat protein
VEHPDTGRAYSLIGSINSMQGDYEEALEMHQKAFEILEKKLGTKDRSTKAVVKKMKMAQEEEEETEL